MLLIAALFFSYKTFYKSKDCKNEKEKRVCVHLQCLSSLPKIKKVEQKEMSQIKPIPLTPKPSKKIKKKPTPKKRVVKKVIVKKKIVVQKKVKAPVVETAPEPVKKAVEKKVLIEPNLHKEVKKEIPSQRVKEPAKEKSISQENLYINKNLKMIVTLLQENLYYPRRARKRGIEGKVVVRFKLSKDAVVSAVEIISSNNDILSRGAIRTIENLSQEFPKPNEPLTISVPISYRLR
jgi:protein TonB